jgi:hypothetical protein
LKTLITVIAASGTLLTYAAVASGPTSGDRPEASTAWNSHAPASAASFADLRIDDPAAENELLEQYCVRCHSDRRLQGNLSLEDFDIDFAPSNDPVLAEKVVVKLRAEMMPPPGARGVRRVTRSPRWS